ncbi:unnamed protein product [Owenia fusiformis]|uniref:Large ribosomal subunit protein mL51 n=1 Tax=Owenia fusiformis TaxID=6347 RepID=A0A8S4N528_OWEFU|nr:unnamed protein product [Owenia fusiformis]
MASLLQQLRRTVAITAQITQQVHKCILPSLHPSTVRLSDQIIRDYSSNSVKALRKRDIRDDHPAKVYDPYFQPQDQSPYKLPDVSRRYGYKVKVHTGGLLPRDDAKLHTMPTYIPKDAWDPKRALFGQNDYIDILGDGTLHPRDLVKGPIWLRGFRGNEMQRLIRRVKMNRKKLHDTFPKKLHDIQKRIKFLHKRYNHRRLRSNFWSGTTGGK